MLTISNNLNAMNKNMLITIIKTFSIDEVEMHLIYCYINKVKLNYLDSIILVKIFKEFVPNVDLIALCELVELNSLKDLENSLELLIPESDRKLNGAFFTPTYIVEYIISQLDPLENDKCLDPSCGCGAFLVGLIDYYRKKYNKSIKNIIRDNIFGVDILDYNVKRTKIILSIYGLQEGEVISEDDFNIKSQDSLKASWEDKFDIVVGNPPYVKLQDLDENTRKSLLQDWRTISNGSFNLYFAFFELGFRLLNQVGRLGYITPNNYFTSLSGVSLRQFFQDNQCLTKIIDFGHFKVFDAQTYTTLTFLNKKYNDHFIYDKIGNDTDISSFLNRTVGSKNYFSNLNVKKWRLLKSQDFQNIHSIESIGTPIKDLFNIAVGIATLKDEVYFIDSATESAGYYKKDTKNGTFLIECEVTKPVYKISCFKSQSEISMNKLRIITPYMFVNGHTIPIPESIMQEKYPKCYEYLCSEKEALLNRDKAKNTFNPFYVWGRTQGLGRFGKKILTPTFSKHPRFMFVSEEEAYYTNGYGIYFKQKSNSNTLFVEQNHPLANEENVLCVQKILNSIIMDYYITNTSVSIQGGYPCYQKNFIEKFTIPDFNDAEINKFKLLEKESDINEFLLKKYRVDF